MGLNFAQNLPYNLLHILIIKCLMLQLIVNYLHYTHVEFTRNSSDALTQINIPEDQLRTPHF